MNTAQHKGGDAPMMFKPHDYQEVAKEFAIQNNAAGLFLDMG